MEENKDVQSSKGKKEGNLLKLIIALVVIGAIAVVVVLGAQGGWFQGSMFSRGAKLKTVAPIEKTVDTVKQAVVTPKELETVKVAVPVTRELEKEMIAKEIIAKEVDKLVIKEMQNIASPLVIFEIETGVVSTDLNDNEISLIGDGYRPIVTEKVYINEMTFACNSHSNTNTDCDDFMQNLYLKLWDAGTNALTILDGPKSMIGNEVTFDVNLWVDVADDVRLRLYGDVSSAAKEGDAFSLDLNSLSNVEVITLEGDPTDRVQLCPSDGDLNSCTYSNNDGYLITIPANIEMVESSIDVGISQFLN